MILVTGGTGLVGSHLILKLLEKHPTVRAIYRTELSLKKTKSLFELYSTISLFDRIDWIHADITDVTALDKVFKGIEQVYHCAALISFDPADENILRKINIEGTANVVNFCLEYHVKKLCYVSSIAALGDLKEFESEITEETEWNPELPHSDYAISKYGAEMEVWRGRQEGLDVVIVNPGIIIGPGFWESGSGQLFRIVKNGLPFYTRGTTGFISIHDVIKCMIHCMESASNEDRFCLISENLSYEFVTKTIAKGLGVKSPRLHVSPGLMGIAWRVDWLFSLLSNKKRQLSKLMVKSMFQKDHYASSKIKSTYKEPFQNIEQCVLECAALYLRK